jgi:hypothetical protein
MKQFFSRGSRTPRANSQSPDAAPAKSEVTLSADGVAAPRQGNRQGSRLGPSPPPPALQAQRSATALDLDTTPRLGQQQQHRSQQHQQPQPSARESVNTGSNYVPAVTPRGGRGNTPRGARRDSSDRRNSSDSRQSSDKGYNGHARGQGPGQALVRNSSSGGSSGPDSPRSGEISARGRSHPQVQDRSDSSHPERNFLQLVAEQSHDVTMFLQKRPVSYAASRVTCRVQYINNTAVATEPDCDSCRLLWRRLCHGRLTCATLVLTMHLDHCRCRCCGSPCPAPLRPADARLAAGPPASPSPRRRSRVAAAGRSTGRAATGGTGRTPSRH